uniref:Uncharacterized protein n=1 Tax=Nelumbo nucifera TaxID=4432 RepID=A0A822Y2U3_NELNU|nr:TPA_asm: hypothetical protein HUJ06_027761 [Nelumbo nucifera]
MNLNGRFLDWCIIKLLFHLLYGAIGCCVITPVSLNNSLGLYWFIPFETLSKFGGFRHTLLIKFQISVADKKRKTNTKLFHVLK